MWFILSLLKSLSSNLEWERQIHQAATCSHNAKVTNRRLGSAELLNTLNLLWMKPHIVLKWVKHKTSFQYIFFSTAFSIFFWLVKMAHIPLVSCSSHAAVCYSMEQAKSMVMDDQSPDSYSGSVCDFLCWLYCEWLGNKLCRKAKHVHSINSMASKSNLNFKINQPIVCSIQLFLNWGIDGWIRMSGWEDTAV